MTKIFLLGGKDLEMITIKELLEKQGEIYFSKDLFWNNATLNHYENELNKYGDNYDYIIYGIELRGETNYKNYKLIDHHNEIQNEPSALEQVAEILSIKLTRYENLVSANDKGYIPAMITLGATSKEINAIRRKDRECQGVTETEELLAKESIINHKIEIDDLIIIKSLSSKFSPICDYLFPYKKLLIYTASELVYYGKDKDLLVEYFLEEIKNETIYHGGGDNGYLGLVSGKYNEEQIENHIQTIKQIVL